MGHAPTRLLGAAFAAAWLLSILATAAAATQGRLSSAPPTPKKARVRASTTTMPTTTTTTLPPPPPLPPPPVIPEGKGMWIWKPELAEGGNVGALVARAKAVGLTHIFVRTGSTWDGLQNMAYLDQLLPAAHAAGIKIYAWDFPKLVNATDDVARAMAAIKKVTPSGDRMDGFAADIETQTEGTQFTIAGAQAYGIQLRGNAGPSTLLVAVVPNPTPQMREKFSYDAVVPMFDAIAPMVYWLNRDPGSDTANAMQFLTRYNKPLMPIGQAYDGGPEGGRPGVPPPAELNLFMAKAQQYNATSVSFWSWQHANAPAWEAIKNGPSFVKPAQPAAAGG